MANDFLNALYRGGMQGATSGWADEAQGGIGAALARVLRPDLFEGQSFLESYKSGRDLARSMDYQAQQQSPKAYAGSGLAAALVAPTKGIGRAGTLSGAAKTGALYGGLAGAGYSEKDTAGGIAQDAGISALASALAAPIIQKIAQKVAGSGIIQDEFGGLKIPKNQKALSEGSAVKAIQQGRVDDPEIYSYLKQKGWDKEGWLKDDGSLSPGGKKFLLGEIESLNRKLEESTKIKSERTLLAEALANHSDVINNAHRNRNMSFQAIPVNEIPSITKKSIYKSPSYNGKQSSEYYLGVVNGEPAYIRKSNHWGKFSTNVTDPKEAAELLGISPVDAEWMAIDDPFGRITRKGMNWTLKDGDETKKNSQAGYIFLKDLLK